MSIEKHLHLLIDSFPDDSYFVVCTNHDGVWQQTPYKKSEIDQAIRFIEVQPKDTSCYLRLTPIKNNPGIGKRGSANAAMGSQYLWLDIDYHTDADFKTSVNKTILGMESSKYPPTFYVKSGRGLHCYWKFNHFETDLKKINGLLRGLVSYYQEYGADPAATDLARVLRIADTYNTKTGEKAELVIPDGLMRIYTDLSIFPPPLGIPVPMDDDVEIVAEPIPDNFEVDIRSKNLNLWQRIESSENIHENAKVRRADGTIDRSRNDYYIVKELLRLNYNPGVILSVLHHPTWFSGERYRSGKHAVAEYDIRTALADRQNMSQGQFFEGKRFKSEKVVEHLQNTTPIISVGRELFLYQVGYYRRDDTTNVIRHRIYEVLHEADCWTSAHENEVYANLQSMDETPMSKINCYAHMINVRNGILNLATGELIPHSKEYFFTNQIPIDYNPEGDKETVTDFLESMLDKDVIPVIWEFVGFCFTPGYEYKAMLFLVGAADSGKTTLLEYIRRILGIDNTQAISLETLANQHFSLGWLFNCLANINSEVSAHVDLLGVEKIKSLASPEQIIAADIKFRKEPIRFVTRAKMMFGANRYPTISRVDGALVERFLCIPCKKRFLAKHVKSAMDYRFDNNIPDSISENLNPADVDLMKKLTHPLVMSGALNLAMLGYRRLIANKGFSESKTISEENRRFEVTVDSVSRFVEEMSKPLETTSHKDTTHDIKPREAYNLFKRWSTNEGLKSIPIKSEFVAKMESSGLVQRIKHSDGEYWRGRIWTKDFNDSLDNFISKLTRQSDTPIKSTQDSAKTIQ